MIEIQGGETLNEFEMGDQEITPIHGNSEMEAWGTEKQLIMITIFIFINEVTGSLIESFFENMVI